MKHIKGWETFKIRRVEGPTALAYGDKIALEAHDGTFVSAHPDGALDHRVTHIKSWETFIVVPRDGESRAGPVYTGEPFALRSHHGTFVMAHNDGRVDASPRHQNLRTEWIFSSAAPTATLDFKSVDPLDG